MIAKRTCLVMGIVFLIVAVWGFIAGDRVLIFHVNLAHNLVHLLSGAAALACALAGVAASRAFSLLFGLVYGLVALLGFAGVTPVIDLLHLNTADNWLHAAISVTFLAAGAASLGRSTPTQPVVRASPRRAPEPESEL